MATDLKLESGHIAIRRKYTYNYIIKKTSRRSMAGTVVSALKQIEDKQYATQLVARGIKEENIRKYGIAFCGKEVLIG